MLISLLKNKLRKPFAFEYICANIVGYDWELFGR